MKALLLLVFSEFRSRPGWILLFILNLSLGLCGLGILEVLRGSMREQLQLNAREMFGGDIRISANEPIPVNIKEILKAVVSEDFKTSSRTSLYTMVGSSENLRLVRIQAISDNWPLYGSLSARDPKGELLKVEDLHASQALWMDPMLGALLGGLRSKGLRIGDSSFEIQGTLHENSTRNLLGLSFSPEVYISQKYLKPTGLLGFGSQVRYEMFLRLSPGANIQDTLVRLREEIHSKISRGRVYQVQSYEAAGERVRRGFKNFESYLALAGMVALLLAVCGISVMHSGYLDEKIPELAILRVLGLSKRRAYAVQLIKLVLLGLSSSLVAVFLSVGIVSLFNALLPGILPEGLQPRLTPMIVVAVLLPGITGSIFPCLPSLRSLRRIELTDLLKSSFPSSSPKLWRDPWWIVSILMIVLWIFLLSSFQARSLKLGGIFTLCILVASGFLLLVGRLLIGPITRRVSQRPWGLFYTLRDLSRAPGSTLLSIVSIGLGVLLVCVLPQIEQNLRSHLENASKGPPDFFLFEIQPDQVQSLSAWCVDRKLELSKPVAMIRSRLLKINDEFLRDYLKRRGKGDDSRGYGSMLLRRGANLSYRESGKWGNWESVSKGQLIFTPSSKIAEVSLERGFARELGLGIGDEMTFDIQGLEFIARVINLRDVTWNSYQPNFFILGSPDHLGSYPASFLATLTIKDRSIRGGVLRELLETFPNFSAVDVLNTLELVSGFLSKMSYGIYFLAIMAILSGLTVLFTISHFEIYREAWKWNLLRVLGAHRQFLRTLVGLRCLLLSGVSSFTALLLSYPIAQVLWKSFFREGDFSFYFQTPLALALFIPILCSAVGFAVSKEILRQKPATLFQSV
jgi:putative ABC transport system permease protein